MLSPRLKLIALCGSLVFLGGVIGWALPTFHPFGTPPPTIYRGGVVYESSVDYQFIDPLLACDVGSEEAFPEFAPLKQTLTNLVNQKIAGGDAQNISIYLRSMKNARWLEINGNQTYAPASLLKTFIMMAYYKEADETNNPGLLQEQIPFQGSPNPSVDDEPGEIIPHLVNGKLYTIDQIIGQMIIYSDNDALDTLLNNFDPQTLAALENIFTDLNIPSPVTNNESSLNFISVDQYAMVFRVLFGSTYLPERYSEKALELLSQAQYQGGIVAGVPSSIDVAHKFGVTTVPATATSTSENELHDCGIVYYPNHPYLLCIMTAGNNFAGLQGSIKDISSAAYQWLDAYYKSLPSSTATSTPSVVTP